MYSLGLNKTLAESWGNYFTTGARSPVGMLCYFSGPVPNSIEEVPFNTGNIHDIFENMEGCLSYKSSLITSGANERVRYTATQDRTFKATTLPYFETALNKWSYTPIISVFEGQWQDQRNGNFDFLDNSEYWGNSIGTRRHNHMQNNYHIGLAQNGIMYNYTKYRNRDLGERSQSGYDFYNYWAISSNRNAGNIYPLVLEFGEPIAVDSFEYYRGWFSGNGNSTTSVGIYYWDETLLSGDGDWVFSETVALVENGTETPVQMSDLVNPIEAKVFKLEFGDTASSTFHMSWFRFLSNASPTTPRASVDITWGLVIPFSEGYRTFNPNHRFENYRPGKVDTFMVDSVPTTKSQHSMPALLVDIGGPHATDNTVNLTKAENVLPGEVPELLNFIIEFLD